MSFTTLTFALYLALVFSVHWLVKGRTARNGVIAGASFIFYAWWDIRFACLMLCSVSVDWMVGLAIDGSTDRARRLRFLWISIAYNLAVLGFFKYFNFFAESFQAMCAAVGWQLGPLWVNIVLPVGISFYTFQSMSYSIDVYRGQLKPTRSFLDYATFVCFFPQLVAGPIERAGHLLGQFQRDRHFDEALARDGCRQILWGVFKKMVLADNLARFVDTAYGSGLEVANGATLAAATVFFAFQIYFDFSAYSDIATGTAKLFGVELMRNFKLPYFSSTLPEFWRRWHISLSTWFRDYVFIPLGGNRHGRVLWIRNILVTFGVSGLWHGASWNFIIWGLLNGVGVVVWMLIAEKTAPISRRWSRFMGVLSTFLFINFTWVFFRAETLADALLILGRIFGDLDRTAAWLALGARLETMLPVLILLVSAVTLEYFSRRLVHPLQLVARLWLPLRWLVYTLFIYVILTVGTLHRGSFIYFQF
jgi:alginate O-acetyltransferase complex protein AlgI